MSNTQRHSKVCLFNDISTERRYSPRIKVGADKSCKFFSSGGKQIRAFIKTVKSATWHHSRRWCIGVSKQGENRSTVQLLRAKYGDSLWAQSHHFACAHKPDFVSFDYNRQPLAHSEDGGILRLHLIHFKTLLKTLPILFKTSSLLQVHYIQCQYGPL